MKTNQINIRDPYIMPYDGKYYLYGTRSETCWGEAYGFDCYISSDLENWEGPKEVFRRPDGFFATECYWAPECYEYNGVFYLLTTFGGVQTKKGIFLLKADRPDGPFLPFGGRLTPEDWTCIDATMFFKDGRVFMVYSHSFEDTPDADICIQELNTNLTGTITPPVKLFAAKEAPWARPVPFAEQEFGMKGDVYFSDGPCVFSLDDGKLYMTWSSWSRGSYAVGLAVSENGRIEGPWSQMETPIWPENGGHGMVFEDFEGNRQFVLHYPNDKTLERPSFMYLKLKDHTVILSKEA